MHQKCHNRSKHTGQYDFSCFYFSHDLHQELPHCNRLYDQYRQFCNQSSDRCTGTSHTRDQYQVDCKINHRSNDFRNQYDILPALRNQNLNTGDIREANQKYRRHDELHRNNGRYIVRTGQHQNCFPCIDDKVNHQWQCHHHNKLHGFRCHLAELIVTFLLDII